MIIDKTGLTYLNRMYSAAYNKGFKRTETNWEKVASLQPSSSAVNDYTWLEGFPQLQEWIGDRVVKNLVERGYSIVNKDYEGTVEVPRNKILDDQYGQYSVRFEDMGYAAKRHPDELVFDLLGSAFSTLCYDGQYMVDTDHPVAGGTVSNDGGGSGAKWFLLDTRRPLKPLVYQKRQDYNLVTPNAVIEAELFHRKKFIYGCDGRGNVGFGFWQQMWGSQDTLNATNFDAAVAAMMLFESEEGRTLGISPNILVVGPSNRALARALIENEKTASGATNTNYKEVDLLVVPELG